MTDADGDLWIDDAEFELTSRTDWSEIAEKVTKNPGKWLLAKRRAPRNYTTKINSGHFPTVLVPGFTITASARNSRGHFADIYVKAERE